MTMPSKNLLGKFYLFCGNAKLFVVLCEKTEFFLNGPDNAKSFKSIFAADARCFFTIDAIYEVCQLSLQRLIGRNEQLFNTTLQAIVHPVRDFFLIDVGHTTLSMNIDALVDEVHVNVVGVCGDLNRMVFIGSCV